MKALLFFLMMLCTSAYARDLMTIVTGVGSVKDNGDEYSILYECTTELELTSCDDKEKRAIENAIQFCKNKNLYFSEIRRDSNQSNSYGSGFLSGNVWISSDAWDHKVFETNIVFNCTNQKPETQQNKYTEEELKKIEQERDKEFYKQLDEEQKREKSRPQGVIMTPHNGKVKPM
jgi:hypothetical protein